MDVKKQKRRLAKDIVNYGLSNTYTRNANSHRKYQNIIDDSERSVEEITLSAIKYNWLMSVGETIKNTFDKDEYANINDIEEEYESVKEMSIRLVEEQGKHSLDYNNPYYEEPY